MPRVVEFIDGYYAVSEPTITGGLQETYLILNNQTLTTLVDSNAIDFEIDSTEYLSAFINFELTRSNSTDSYTQAGSAIMVCVDDVWRISFGNYDGDSMVNDAVSAVSDVVFTVTNSTTFGGLQYSSGNMGVTDYEGVLRMSITRIARI